MKILLISFFLYCSVSLNAQDTLIFHVSIQTLIDKYVEPIKWIKNTCFYDTVEVEDKICFEYESFRDTMDTMTYKIPCKIYINGHLREIGQFYLTRRLGNYIQFYSNGKVKMKGQFDENGYKIGKWYYYNKKGTVKERNYKKGRWYRRERFLLEED